MTAKIVSKCQILQSQLSIAITTKPANPHKPLARYPQIKAIWGAKGRLNDHHHRLTYTCINILKSLVIGKIPAECLVENLTQLNRYFAQNYHTN
ncbi:MAG: hypothetical protein WBB28_13165 [Crinalium sp.]